MIKHLFHRHKWEYLGKEFHERRESRFYSGGLSALGSSSVDKITNITTIRFFCKGCSEIKSQTVDGNMKAAEIAQIQGYNLSKEEI